MISANSKGSNPFELIIKPFPEEMKHIAIYFHKFLIENRMNLEL